MSEDKEDEATAKRLVARLRAEQLEKRDDEIQPTDEDHEIVAEFIKQFQARK